MVDSPPAARSAAVQQRSRKRRDAILDAAEALMIEDRYEGATLKAISERTGIPIASVYHYFADRTQVDAEVAQRHAEGLATGVSAALVAAEGDDLVRTLDRVVQAYVDYYRSHPGFLELWLARRTAVLSATAEGFDVAQSESLRRALIERGLIAGNTPPLVARMGYEAGSRLLDMAFRVDRHGDPEMIAETSKLLAAYLGTYAV
ncbi:hypothetical protein GCM10009624_25960 [Gordonia sinesedis]